MIYAADTPLAYHTIRISPANYCKSDTASVIWLFRELQNCIVHMNIAAQIKSYIDSQPEPKRSDMQSLHRHILQLLPGYTLWFLDGKNAENKTVTNPNIGYGSYTIKYADGKTKEFYQIGLSANTTGISVYILGIKDKTYLSTTYGRTLGKASVSGYCIKFKTLKDVNLAILEAAILDGVKAGAA